MSYYLIFAMIASEIKNRRLDKWIHKCYVMDIQKKGGNQMGKMGRPTENPAKNQFRVRLTDGELEKLNECTQYYQLSKSDVIRKGIDKLYEGIKK